jgi:hypothetical protein
MEREYTTKGGEDSGIGGADNQSEHGLEAEDGFGTIEDTSYVKDLPTIESSNFVTWEVLD